VIKVLVFQLLQVPGEKNSRYAMLSQS